jgi:predicted ATPase
LPISRTLGCVTNAHPITPHHTASAFYPIIEHLKRAAGFDPDDPPVTQLDKLEAMIAPATLQVKDMAPLFAALLSLPSGDRYPSLGLSAPQRRQQTLAALLDQLEGVATRQPVLLVFEDVHWADASTVEVLDLMIERVRALPVLALLTYRPEFEPSWVGRDTVTLLALGRLDRAEACAMIERVSTGKPLPDEVMAQILAKTDGVPLFVEELTKTVLESGLLVEDARGYRLDGLLSPLAIPATLQDSLMARLDRLAPVREIAQIGAAIGREFSYALLHAVAGRKDAALDAALARLEAAELLFQSAAPPDARYRFKHALVQDAAYETLLRSQRQILHRRIAETLREHFPAIVEGEPEMIAHHFTQAGLTEQAVEWWSKAGEQGAGRSAYIEAIAHYGQAIALADTLSIAPSRQQSRLGLQIAYGQALNAARGPGALETTAAFARARELAAQIENLKERFPVYNGLWISNVARGEVASARSVAEAFLRETETRPGSPEAGMAHRTMGMTACMEGNLVDAQVHLGRAVASYHSGWDQPLRSHYGQDLGIAAMNNLAVVLWQIGEVGRACEFAEEGLTRAVHTGHIPTMVYGYFYKCIFEAQRRNAERAMSSSEPLVDLSPKHFTQSNWLAMGTFVLGWARWLTGDREAGTAGMRQGIAFFREHGLFYNLTLLRGLFAETEAAAGNLETALATLDDAFCDAERTGLRWFRSELYRQRGEILLLLRPGDLPAAEQAFDSALTIARRQQARSFELRAALSLARLRRDQGRCTEAGDLLAPVYGWFTEGFDTPDLREAKALLDGLA